MKIGIDGSSLTKSKITGIENFIRNFIIELQDSKYQKIHFSIYSPNTPEVLKKLPKNFKIITAPGKRFWGQTILPKLINLDKPDVVYLPSNIPPKGIKTKIVCHIHDLAWKVYPSSYSKIEYWKQYLTVKRAKKIAVTTITASQSTADDLIKYFKFKRANIAIVPLGFNQNLTKLSQPFNTKKGFIFTGRFETRKNLLNILKAYKSYYQSATSPEPLYLCGHPGFGFEKIDLFLKNIGDCKKQIHIKQNLSPEKFYQLFASCKSLLYPSLYEGFGLPILEAFALKTAVITAPISSMPEVAGNGAIYVNPTDIEEISQAMRKIVSDEGTRSVLVQRGLQILEKYSWKKTAEKIINILINATKI